jgi:hypothetical protein
MQAQRFAVEYNRTVVGVAVRVPGGFMFYSSDPDFDQHEGQMFPRARAMSRRIAEVAKAMGRPVLQRARAGDPQLAVS